MRIMICSYKKLLGVGQYRDVFFIVLDNENGDQLEVDDDAHSHIQSHAEIKARADVLRAATGWQIEDRTQGCV